MRRRTNADDVARLIRESDRDLAKGLTVSDVAMRPDTALKETITVTESNNNAIGSATVPVS
jgi:hypothetical protein